MEDTLSLPVAAFCQSLTDAFVELAARMTALEQRVARLEGEMSVAADVHEQLDRITADLVSIRQMAESRLSRGHKPPRDPRVN